MSEILPKILIIDFGSSETKIGFSGKLDPQYIIPTVIGYSKFISDFMPGSDIQDYIGDDAISIRGVLKLHYPINKGVIVDWEQLEKFLYIFFQSKLRIDPKYLSFILTIPDNADLDYRNKLKTLFNEKFKGKDLKLVNQGFLALRKYNLESGIVIDAGNTKINVIPYFRNKFVNQGFKQMELGGKTIVDRLQKLLLANKGYRFVSVAERMILEQMNEKLGYISLVSYDNSKRTVPEKTYELPDGQIISITPEISDAPEIIFTPELAEIPVNSLQKTIFESLIACNQDERSEIVKNIILVGGLTKMSGFKERLEVELNKQFSSSFNFTIISGEANDLIVFNAASEYCLK